MLDVQPIISLLQSTAFQEHVQSGAVDSAGPASPDQLRAVEAQLPSELYEALLPLLSITSGFDLFPEPMSKSSHRDAPILSIDLARFKPEIWDTVYPIAAEIGAFEEFLYWDLIGEPAGQVFFVDHDGPLHCLAFQSLQDAIDFFLAQTPEEAWRKLTSLPAVRSNWPTVRDFQTGDAELLSFLAKFPPHYTVHDLRQATISEAFPYNASGPGGFVRWGPERLFIQRQPKNWIESLKWWWNPNVS